MTIGERIKAARLDKGYTQEQLAQMIGVAKSTLTGYEKGNREPDAMKINALARALDVTGDYLLDTGFKPSVSTQAMEIARAYDKMSSYGKSLIDKIVENEGKYKVMKAVPVIGIAYQDGTVETKFAAKMEQRELTEEENALNPEKN